ncbi:MAG TPA: hypothetical protein VGD45_13795 [Steroidobacter sp.]|uniref:hypothetical protein n=1 Tax=Steroidobacter sp. TaxID=1978227 RepID=UPI002EDABA57
MKVARVLIMTSALAPATLLATGLEPSFGNNGRVVVEDRYRVPSDAILQRDGKIVVVGGSEGAYVAMSQMFFALSTRTERRTPRSMLTA